MFPNNHYIREFIRKNAKQTFWNKRRLQSFYSYTCGEWCCVWGFSMSRGESLECFMKQFGNKHHSNDEKVRSLYRCIFQARCGQNCTSFFNCIQKM